MWRSRRRLVFCDWCLGLPWWLCWMSLSITNAFLNRRSNLESWTHKSWVCHLKQVRLHFLENRWFITQIPRRICWPLHVRAWEGSEAKWWSDHYFNLKLFLSSWNCIDFDRTFEWICMGCWHKNKQLTLLDQTSWTSNQLLLSKLQVNYCTFQWVKWNFMLEIAWR